MTGWVEKLLQWFSIHRREMPWRDDPSPYKVWVSEIMLQQTRVSAVIPYFENFIRKFPDVHQLAQAPLQDVLKAWEGLGYYSRARNLHRAANHIACECQGRFPDSEEKWLTIPGVGPYTAAAVTSIAFGKPAAAIDGNVMRVWSRMRGIKEDTTPQTWKSKARKDLLRYTKQCNPSLFNQAMMELGALVCLPKNPACTACPLASNCIARRKKLTNEIPFRKKRTAVPHRNEVVLVIYAQNKVLMRQRPSNGLLGGLWEFPCITISETKSRKRKARDFTESLGIPVQNKLTEGYTIEHAFTHFTQSLFVYTAEIDKRFPTPDDHYKWCSMTEVETLPLSRTQRRIADKERERQSR